MKNPLVSIIIVNWNGAAYLHSCLTSIYRQTYPRLEIIIIDNASTDNSCQVIEDFQKTHGESCAENGSQTPASSDSARQLRLKFFQNRANEGFCRANNQGILQSHGDFILLLNADVTLDFKFIEFLVDEMGSDPTIGISLGKLLNGYDTTKIDSTGIVIRRNRRAFDRGQGEDDTGQYNTKEEVFGGSGAACLYRKRMLEDIKYHRNNLRTDGTADTQPGRVHDEYLDELFFAYKEDVDLSWRARLYGWNCLYIPDAVGYHLRQWGTGKRTDIPKWIRRHSLKNRYLMLIKNECRETLFPHFLSILWFELQSFVYILVREPYLFLVIRDIIKLWPDIMEKRRITQTRARQSDLIKDLASWFQ